MSHLPSFATAAQTTANTATTAAAAAQTTASTAAAAIIVRQSQAVTLANIQAKGAVLTATFNVGAVLPTNARAIGVEVNTTQAFAGVGFVSAALTVQGGADAVGSMMASLSVAATGTKSLAGLNPYFSRGGQQVACTLTIVGLNMVALTAGAFTVNLLYAVIP